MYLNRYICLSSNFLMCCLMKWLFFLLLFRRHPAPVRPHRTTTARRARQHSHYLPDDSPSFYRRDLQGGLNRAPVSGHSMEFLRGIYAFMQVSRSSVSVSTSTTSCHHLLIFLQILFHIFSFSFSFECSYICPISVRHPFAVQAYFQFCFSFEIRVCASYDEISLHWKIYKKIWIASTASHMPSMKLPLKFLYSFS